MDWSRSTAQHCLDSHLYPNHHSYDFNVASEYPSAHYHFLSLPLSQNLITVIKFPKLGAPIDSFATVVMYLFNMATKGSLS